MHGPEKSEERFEVGLETIVFARVEVTRSTGEASMGVQERASGGVGFSGVVVVTGGAVEGAGHRKEATRRMQPKSHTEKRKTRM